MSSGSVVWRVLLVSELIPDPQPGGLARHVLALADALAARGCSVDLLGNALYPIERHPEQAGPGRFIAAIDGHQRLWKQRELGAFHPLASALPMRALARKIMAAAPGYDVVHYHGHWPGVAARLPRTLPFTQTRHDASGDCWLKTRFRAGGDDESARCTSVDPSDCAGCAARLRVAAAIPKPWQRALSRIAVRGLRAATAQGMQRHPAIFVSADLQQRCARALAAPGAATRLLGEVIPHALPRAPFEAALRAPLPARAAGVEVFGAGALLPYKGFAALLDRLDRHPPNPDWRLTIAGDGPELAGLRGRRGPHALHLPGWLDQSTLLLHLRAADAVVVPSLLDESGPGAALEALAFGRVVYALARGGTPELARHAGPGSARLRLFSTLDELATALLAHRADDPATLDPAPALAAFVGDAEALADSVLAHYARHFRPGASSKSTDRPPGAPR